MPNSEARLNRRYIEMQKLLIVYTNHFPSQEKYALTSRILNASYGMYELMIEAQYLFHKKTTLGNLSKRHEQLRMLVLLAHEFGYFRHATKSKPDPQAEATRRYLALSKRIDEIGRLIGGWIAADKKKHAAVSAA